MYSPFCSTTFCHSSSNFIILSSLNLIFLSKELFWVAFTVLRELKFFPLREFCKDQNKWKPEGTMFSQYCEWIKTSQPSCNNLCLVIKYTHHAVLGHFSQFRFCATQWTVARQAPLSMGFSRQEYCSGLPFSSPGALPNPGIEPACPCLTCISRWVLYH